LRWNSTKFWTAKLDALEDYLNKIQTKKHGKNEPDGTGGASQERLTPDLQHRVWRKAGPTRTPSVVGTEKLHSASGSDLRGRSVSLHAIS
jgi:hypothetical protein